jgi:hypothetical protein
MHRILAIALLSGIAVAQDERPSNCGADQFGLMMDGGSTGSRIHVHAQSHTHMSHRCIHTYTCHATRSTHILAHASGERHRRSRPTHMAALGVRLVLHAGLFSARDAARPFLPNQARRAARVLKTHNDVPRGDDRIAVPHGNDVIANASNDPLRVRRGRPLEL